jgi:flagellar hook-length control protein FliK
VPTAAGASTPGSVAQTTAPAPQASTAPQADPPAVATTTATDQSAQPATPAATTPAPAVTAAVVAAPAAPAQAAPETPTTAAAPAVTQANDVTSSKTGDDTRRSRDEAGVAEQPSRLAPAADQQAPVQTVAAQDAPATKDVAAAPAMPQPQTPVRLAELAHAAQTAITVASQNGSTSARITLHPDELGAVQIHLRYGADGVSATVRADSPQAAQILHQAAPDLKRALEGQGMSLLGFDVRDRSGNPADRDQSSPQGGSSNGGGNADPDPDDDLTGPAAIAVDPASLPSPGSQIDVLA